jgi:hypothetical protein
MGVKDGGERDTFHVLRPEMTGQSFFVTPEYFYTIYP